jgi:hypothetical protein
MVKKWVVQSVSAIAVGAGCEAGGPVEEASVGLTKRQFVVDVLFFSSVLRL